MVPSYCLRVNGKYDSNKASEAFSWMIYMYARRDIHAADDITVRTRERVRSNMFCERALQAQFALVALSISVSYNFRS